MFLYLSILSSPSVLAAWWCYVVVFSNNLSSSVFVARESYLKRPPSRRQQRNALDVGAWPLFVVCRPPAGVRVALKTTTDNIDPTAHIWPCFPQRDYSRMCSYNPTTIGAVQNYKVLPKVSSADIPLGSRSNSYWKKMNCKNLFACIHTVKPFQGLKKKKLPNRWLIK